MNVDAIVVVGAIIVIAGSRLVVVAVAAAARKNKLMAERKGRAEGETEGGTERGKARDEQSRRSEVAAGIAIKQERKSKDRRSIWHIVHTIQSIGSIVSIVLAYNMANRFAESENCRNKAEKVKEK